MVVPFGENNMKSALFIILLVAIPAIAAVFYSRMSSSDDAPKKKKKKKKTVGRAKSGSGRIFKRKTVRRIKTLSLILLLILVINGMLILGLQLYSYYTQEDVIYIAVAGPVIGHNGVAIRRGVELCKDEINAQGGIDGRKVELLIFDDQNDKKTAEEVAERIAQENKALVVLGHYYSSASLAAGKIYERNEIPAITVSMSNAVTFDNDWYFRVVPNNELQAGFIANYINRGLDKRTAYIMHAKDEYSLSLAKAFETEAKRLGLGIKGMWGFDIADKNLDEALKQITDEFIAADNPEVLFLAMFAPESAKIITTLKDAGKDCLIFGSDVFASEVFLIELKKYHKEQLIPGYYSDGLYFTTPFMPEMADEEAYIFKNKFMEKYHTIPVWESACYYDAMRVALRAIREVGIQGQDFIRQDRRKIKDVLAGIYNRKKAIRGVTGEIYFDENGDVKKPYVIGTYRKQHKMLPAFSQYRQVGDTQNISAFLLKNILSGTIMEVDGILMNNTRLIYTGMDVIEVSNLKPEKSECTIEFYLWFRYPGYFDDSNIDFSNSQTNIDLGEPIREEIKNGITTRVYRVKADFNIDFDLRAYPFDVTHVIPIKFRHITQTNNWLMYVPDVLSLPDTVSARLPEWEFEDIFFYQNVVSKYTSLGIPKFFNVDHKILSYSQFNTEIQIKRKNLAAFISKRFLPLLFILSSLYLTFFIRPDRIGLRIFISTGAAITSGVCHQSLGTLVVYLTAFDYAFFTAYMLAVISAVISVLVYKFHGHGKERMVRFLTFSGKVGFPCVVSGLVGLLVYMYR